MQNRKIKKYANVSLCIFLYIYSFKIITMKAYIIITTIIMGLFLSCNSSKNYGAIKNATPKLESDTIKIENKALEYEIIIIDIGFSSWFNTFAKPRDYYSQSYLEARNKLWVIAYNNKTNNPMNRSIYEWPIDYSNNVDYGYEVNYMLYNYLVYFQLKYKQKLGGFSPKI